MTLLTWLYSVIRGVMDSLLPLITNRMAQPTTAEQSQADPALDERLHHAIDLARQSNDSNTTRTGAD